MSPHLDKRLLFFGLSLRDSLDKDGHCRVVYAKNPSNWDARGEAGTEGRLWPHRESEASLYCMRLYFKGGGGGRERESYFPIIRSVQAKL